jgi:hypothetical protein
LLYVFLAIVDLLVAEYHLRARVSTRRGQGQILRRDPSHGMALASMLSDLAVPSRVRLALIDVMVRADDAPTLRTVLAAAGSDLDRIRNDGQKEPEARLRVQVVLRGLLGHPRLSDMEGDANLLELLEWGSQHGFEGVGREEACAELMLSAPVDERARSRLLTNLFLFPNTRGQANCRMPLGAINTEDRARLRQPLEEWAGEVSNYPQRAVLALVMIGDEATLERLREWSVSDRLRDERRRSGLAELVIFGEGHRDADAALRYVRSCGIPAGSELAVCAMDDAVRLGASREALRSALFERERRVAELIVQRGWSEKSSRRLRSIWLWPVKQAGVELGLLGMEEWSQVTAPQPIESVTP